MKRIFLVCVIILFFSLKGFASPIPPGQTGGATLRRYSEGRRKEKVEKTLKSYVRPALNAEPLRELPGRRLDIFIGDIVIQKRLGDGFKSDPEISLIDNKARHFTLDAMNRLVHDLTVDYAIDGFVFYVPKQRFEGDVMYINYRRE